MFEKINNLKLDHYAHHLAVTSLVVFLLVLNFTMFNYASAASGSEVDSRVNASIQNTVNKYQVSSQYMYDYSVTWGELLLGWDDFIVDTYYQFNN
jgi:hypothetical protein